MAEHRQAVALRRSAVRPCGPRQGGRAAGHAGLPGHGRVPHAVPHAPARRPLGGTVRAVRRVRGAVVPHRRRSRGLLRGGCRPAPRRCPPRAARPVAHGNGASRHPCEGQDPGDGARGARSRRGAPHRSRLGGPAAGDLPRGRERAAGGLPGHRGPRTGRPHGAVAVGLAAAAHGRGGHAVPVPTAAGGLPGTGHRVGGPPPVLGRAGAESRRPPGQPRGQQCLPACRGVGPVHRSAGRDGAAQRFGASRGPAGGRPRGQPLEPHGRGAAAAAGRC